MSGTDHSRPRRAWGAPSPQHADQAPKHHPRPALRRAKTKADAIRRALKEA